MASGSYPRRQGKHDVGIGGRHTFRGAARRQARQPSYDTPVTTELERLLAPDTPLDESLRLFAHLRTTPTEARAIEAVLARTVYAVVPEALVVAVASALVDRGEHGAALQALVRTTSSEALMLRAELLARGDDLAVALALVERVLLRDFDWPGARERYARWREALGVSVVPRADPSTTMMTSAPEAPFRLLREVGRGGAGVVYEAEDRVLRRRVALKVYHQADRDRTQLLHEAHVAVALEGRGVVRVFDANPDHGWLVMEWAQRGALRSLLRDRDLAALRPIERWALPLASAEPAGKPRVRVPRAAGGARQPHRRRRLWLRPRHRGRPRRRHRRSEACPVATRGGHVHRSRCAAPVPRGWRGAPHRLDSPTPCRPRTRT